MSRPLLEFRRTSLLVGTHPLLKEIEWAVVAGTFTALLGPNGAGKTTLLRVAAGLKNCTGGQVLWDDRNLRHYTPRKAALFRRWCAEEESAGFSVQGVLSAGIFPLDGRWSDLTSDQKRRAQRLQQDLELEIDPDDSRPFLSLSLGERRLVHLIRTFLVPAPLYLLDEPTGPLDLRHKLLVAKVLREQVEAGSAVVASFHDLNEAWAIADSVAVVDHGRLVAEGKMTETLTPRFVNEVWGVDAPSSFPAFWKLPGKK